MQYFFQIAKDTGLEYATAFLGTLASKSTVQGEPLPRADQLTDSQRRRGLLEANIGFCDFKDLRGTPDYDEQGKKKAFAMLRQLDESVYLILNTFSMADIK